MDAQDSTRDIADGDDVADPDRTLAEHDETGHEVRHDLLQSEPQTHAKSSDQPLNVTPANAEDAAREENAYERNRVPRDYLDRVRRIGLHLESLQQHDVEQRADVAHHDRSDYADDDRKKKVTNSQRAAHVLAIGNLRVIP